MRDYSEYLTPELLELEERGWAEGFHNRKMADMVVRLCAEHGLKTVIEMGCGTGWVPSFLPEQLSYTGVDKNQGCLDRAVAKNGPDRVFVREDIRGYTGPQRDLVCSLSVLKHFRPEEWREVFLKIMSLGRYACFTMSIGPKIVNDGVAFPHTYIRREDLERSLALAGKTLTYEERLTPDVHGYEFLFAAAPVALEGGDVD